MPAPTLVSGVHPGRVQSLRFDDLDVMASTINGHVEFVPIKSSYLNARFSQIDFDGFLLKRIVHTPFLIHGAVPLGRVAIHLLARPAEGVTLNGDAFGTSTLAVLPEGAAAQAACPTEQDRISLVFNAGEFDQLIETCGAQTVLRGRHRMLRLHEDQASRLVRTFTAMTDLADSMPHLFAMPGISKAMTEECQSLLAGALGGADVRPDRSRQTKDMLRQVSAADEFLHANIDRPVYTTELCAALHISARTLHQSFAAVYGMSPHAYLKRRRLTLVCRALRSAHEDQSMVKSIVLAHGFWHLGRFAHEYAAMFGEMPSETFGKGRGRVDPAIV